MLAQYKLELLRQYMYEYINMLPNKHPLTFDEWLANKKQYTFRLWTH